MTSAPRNLLRILVVGPDPARYVGGIASFVRFQMTSSALSREFKLLNLDTGAAVGKRRPALYRLLRACFRLARLILALVRYRPSLAHIHASSSGSFFEKAAMALFCRVAAVRTILHIHSGNFEAFYKGSRCRWFIRFCLDRAGAIVTVSPRWSAFFSAVTSSRIETVPNCPAEEFFDAGSSPGKNRNMVFSGLLCGYKGVPELFEAVRLLRERGLDNPLVLLGESGEDLELESHRAQAQAMGLRNVSFRGEVSSGEVAGALADAAVFVLPSHEEGLPIAMLEAMAAGLPVVVTPVGGVPDAVQDGVNGYLVPAGDCRTLAGRLELLLRNPDLRQKMGAANREKARLCYHPETSARVLAGLYHSLAH